MRMSITRVAKGFVATLLLLGVGLMFANVVARHLFAAPFYWTEEVAVYLNIWCVFVGAALVTRENAHLRMDLLVHALPSRWAARLNALSLIATVIVCAVVAFSSWTLLGQLWQADLRSVAVGLPMVVPHLAVFVGFVAMLVAALFTWRRAIHPTSEPDEAETDAVKESAI
jgi:TRAP-type C4-dicarboxylate transport system permease small subunit